MLATARTVEEFSGSPAFIKWVNDVYLFDKKVAGILAERVISESVTGEVIGIGTNLQDPDDGFPDDIKDVAGSLNLLVDKRAEYIGALVKNLREEYENFDKKSALKTFREKSYLTGEGRKCPGFIRHVQGARSRYRRRLRACRDERRRRVRFKKRRRKHIGNKRRIKTKTKIFKPSEDGFFIARVLYFGLRQKYDIMIRSADVIKKLKADVSSDDFIARDFRQTARRARCFTSTE